MLDGGAVNVTWLNEDEDDSAEVDDDTGRVESVRLGFCPGNVSFEMGTPACEHCMTRAAQRHFSHGALNLRDGLTVQDVLGRSVIGDVVGRTDTFKAVEVVGFENTCAACRRVTSSLSRPLVEFNLRASWGQ